MKTLLTICIPTYKRPTTLRRCLDSLVEQIEKFAVSNRVNIFVANDASPDETEEVLQSYRELSYFDSVTREQNLGMNQNIKAMLGEVAKKSDFQLIITDDDFLQPDILGEIVDFLEVKRLDGERASAIWTPRYSYTEDGELFCIVCNPFKRNAAIKPSAFNTGLHMFNGFILSGIITRADFIDYDFWDSYKENAFFPILFIGDLLLRNGGYYWDKNIVHHTVLNKCHWESWGGNDIIVALRLFSDNVNTYSIMADRIGKTIPLILYNIGSFRNICCAFNTAIFSDKSLRNHSDIARTIDNLREKGLLKFKLKMKAILFSALILNVISTLFKLLRSYLFSGLRQNSNNKEQLELNRQKYSEKLRILPIILRLVF